MNCPACKAPLEEAGRTHECKKCEGAWVRGEVLVPMLEQSASTLVELPWKPNVEDHVRGCPECEQAMQTVKLGTVALDRCEAHGVWFDAKELAALLGQAKKFRAETQQGVGGPNKSDEHRGLLRRLAKLFG
jgi:Zn-finger nucleic acid-binding protein